MPAIPSGDYGDEKKGGDREIGGAADEDGTNGRWNESRDGRKKS